MAKASWAAPEAVEKRGAIIFTAQLPGEDSETADESLTELEQLLRTLEIPTLARLIQRRVSLVPATLVGEGKLDEIRTLAATHQAALAVCDRPLSPPQVRNLEKHLGLPIMDRSNIILDIFARHAKTREAKTQVEIARLEYLLPRLTGAWTHFQRQAGGGVTTRGMGETQIEIDRRRARDRIARLRCDLDAIRRERAVLRKGRMHELRTALVGYTNSGKTSIMSALTRSTATPEDKLFATLDTSVRALHPATRPNILLTDTVGFIHNLPHSLVESFKSTFDEVRDANLLLHVVDLSHPRYREQMDTTRAVLTETGIGNIPEILVFNKADQVKDPWLARVVRRAYPGSVVVSTRDAASMDCLRQRICEHFTQGLLRTTLDLPVQDGAALALAYASCHVERVDYDRQHPERIQLTVQGTLHALGKLGVISNTEGETL